MKDIENLENFDWNYYLEKNEDLRLNGINTKESALNHWVTNGKNENRLYKFINNDIDLKIYIEKFKYLEEKKYITKEDAWNLILIIYDKLYNDDYIDDMNYFDWIYYIKNNTDLYDNNIVSKEDAINHWNNFGKYENRNNKFTYNILNDIDDIDDIIKNYLNKNKTDDSIDDSMDEIYDIDNFDWKYYIKNNKDLIECNIFTKDDAFNHWYNFGKYEKRLYRFEISDKNFVNEEIFKETPNKLKKETLKKKTHKEETPKKEIPKKKNSNEETKNEDTSDEDTPYENTPCEDTPYKDTSYETNFKRKNNFV